MPSHRPDFGRPVSEPSTGRYGVYPARVVDNRDPMAQGRLKIVFEGQEYWARLATLMAGPNQGSWFLPDVNNEVLVAFEGGDVDKPYVIGALWNALDRPPESMDAEESNNRKVLRSRNGLKITLDDQTGQENLIVETPGAQKVTLRDGPGSVVIEDSNGNSIKLAPEGVTVMASGKVIITASVVEISSGMITVNAGTARFSGLVQCDSLVTNSVVSASYSPGAGNVW